METKVYMSPLDADSKTIKHPGGTPGGKVYVKVGDKDIAGIDTTNGPATFVAEIAGRVDVYKLEESIRQQAGYRGYRVNVDHDGDSIGTFAVSGPTELVAKDEDGKQKPDTKMKLDEFVKTAVETYAQIWS